MKTLIAYRTKYGTTGECARTLAEKIGGETTVVDLAQEPRASAAGYDVVLVGGSIYAGKIQRQVVSFCEHNRDSLMAARVGIFLCCLFSGEDAAVQMQASFPDWLLAHAFGRAFAGGRVAFDRLSLLDRLLVWNLPHPRGDISLMRPQALDELAAAALRTPGR